MSELIWDKLARLRREAATPTTAEPMNLPKQLSIPEWRALRAKAKEAKGGEGQGRSEGSRGPDAPANATPVFVPGMTIAMAARSAAGDRPPADRSEKERTAEGEQVQLVASRAPRSYGQPDPMTVAAPRRKPKM